MRVVTLFSGYDSQCMALDRLGLDYELVAWAEIDRHAIKAHNAVYPQWADRNVGDVTGVDWNVTGVDWNVTGGGALTCSPTRVPARISARPALCAAARRGRRYGQELEIRGGISNALTSVQKDNLLIVGNYLEKKGGRKNPSVGRIYDTKGVSPTLDTMGGGGNRQPKIIMGYKIRRLTPRECFRLMDVSEADIDKIQDAGISKTQQYRMAGNSIVVACMEGIFGKLFMV